MAQTSGRAKYVQTELSARLLNPILFLFGNSQSSLDAALKIPRQSFFPYPLVDPQRTYLPISPSLLP